MSRFAPRRLVATTALTCAAMLLAACSYDDAPTGPRGPAALRAAPNLNASTLVVTSLADDGSAGTLRKAIGDATDGTTITFDASLAGGTIQLVGGGLAVAKAITIEGPGPQGVTIRGTGTSRVILVTASGPVTLRDLTLTGGTASIGGAILAVGELVLERVLVTGNEATSAGGGVHVDGTLRVRNSTIAGNKAALAGGGIYMSATDGTFEMVESTVRDNDAGSWAGGLYSGQGTALIDRSTISGNSSVLEGGGLVTQGATTIRNSTVSGNSAGDVGGGVAMGTGNTELVHVTIADNTSGVGGAGVDGDASASYTLTNVILANNTNGGSNANCGGAGTRTLAGYNFSVADATCGAQGFTLSQLDPWLGPLADNGGPTQTHALQRGSVAINTAFNLCPVTVDQRNVARPQGPYCEPGAAEFTDYAIATFTVDPSGLANSKNGTAVVSGTVACVDPLLDAVEFVVTVKQTQKARRLTTVVQGSSPVQQVDFCWGSTTWAVAVAPFSGAFVNAPVEVTVQTWQIPNWVAPVNLTVPNVTLAWSRR